MSLLEEIKNEFYFLVRDHDFSDPLIFEDRSITKVIYVKNKIALEFVIDEKDNDFEVKIQELRNGSIHDYFKYDDEGLLCRDSLLSFMRALKISVDDVFTKQIDKVKAYSELIKIKANFILSGISPFEKKGAGGTNF